jgi:serine protease Do
MAIGGQPVKDARALQRTVAALPLGKAAELSIFRDGKRQTLSVTVEEQPREFAALAGSGSENSEGEQGPTVLGQTGMKVVELNPDRAKEFGYPKETEGVAIVEVEANSMADRAGLANGTLIVKVDGTLVKTVDQALQALKRGSFDKGIVLQVKTPRGGTTYTVLKSVNE